MYHGHYALGLLMKALAGRTVPAGPFIWGSSILDMVGGAFGLMGLSDYQPTTDLRASSYIYTRFDDIDYTHSLLAASLISILAGVAFHKLGGYSQKSSVYGALASLGHWLFDSLVINKRLALYPRSNYHFGLGAYTSFPIGSWVAETLFCLFAGLVAQTLYRKRGADISPLLAIFAVQCLSFSPWTSALYYLPGLKWGRQLNAVMFIIGYAIPSYFWVQLLNRADRSARSKLSKSR